MHFGPWVHSTDDDCWLAVRFHSQTQWNVPMAGIVVMTPSVLAEECKNFYSEYVLIFPSQPTGMGWFLSLAILPLLPLLFTLHATLFMIKGHHRSRTDSRTCSTNQPTSSPVRLSLSVQEEELRFFRDEMTISLHQPLRITYLFIIIILCTHHSGHGGKEHQVAQS